MEILGYILRWLALSQMKMQIELRTIVLFYRKAAAAIGAEGVHPRTPKAFFYNLFNLRMNTHRV